MQLSVSTQGNARILTLKGRLDSDASTEFEERCQRLLQSSVQVMVLDFTAVDYLSSAGLRTILSLGKALQAADGKLVLVVPKGPVHQILEATGFDKMFPICATAVEAGKHTAGTFQIHLRKDWDVDIMTIFGRVDAERAPEVEAAGRKILEAGHLKLIISLSPVQYLSSAGLCALLNLGKLAQTRKCRVFLCGPPPEVKHVLVLSGFDKLFPIRDTVDAALVE